MMNRDQRRKYYAKVKNNSALSECPICHYKSLFRSYPQLKPYEGTKEKFTAEDFNVVVKCDICGSIVLEGETVTKLIRPGITLPLPLDIFQKALQYADEHPEEMEKNET